MSLLTIRTKVTLWYSFSMLILISIILGTLVEFTDLTIFTTYKNNLVHVVEEAIEDIEEGDDFDYFEDGVYLLFYNQEGKYIYGIIPDSFSLSFPLKVDSIQNIEVGEKSFYIYDRKFKNESGETMWIRGVVSNLTAGKLGNTVVSIAFILLPILVIISTLIGFFITKKAFKPVKKIQEIAESITQGDNLSLRIGLKGKDEISKLGKTIDLMLEKLENSFEKEKQFTSDVSHELRTPVSVILAESEYILEHGESLEEACESMEVVKKQANKISVLINQLLFFARAEQGKIILNYEDVDILKTIEDIVYENKIPTQEKNITVTIQNSLNNKRTISVDKTMFCRSVQNLLQNSISYGKNGGKIEINLFFKEEYLAIQVKDDGIGINSENLTKIWDKFYQVNSARSSNFKGSMGLGLTMVKWIVEKHRGYIEVESTLGVGSIFTLYFPL